MDGDVASGVVQTSASSDLGGSFELSVDFEGDYTVVLSNSSSLVHVSVVAGSTRVARSADCRGLVNSSAARAACYTSDILYSYNSDTLTPSPVGETAPERLVGHVPVRLLEELAQHRVRVAGVEHVAADVQQLCDVPQRIDAPPAASSSVRFELLVAGGRTCHRYGH